MRLRLGLTGHRAPSRDHIRTQQEGSSSCVYPCQPSAPRRRRMTIATALVALALVVPAAVSAAKPPTTPPRTVDVQLLAINDFHGNLQPPSGSGGRIGLPPPAMPPACVAADVLSSPAALRTWRTTSRTSRRPTRTGRWCVSAGDNIGGTPLISAAFHDEPTIEALNLLGLDVSAVGNHEFDEGVDELLRIQNGGCHPVDGCDTGHTLRGRRLPVPGRQRRLQGQWRADPPGLHDRARRRGQGRLHRPDARGHPADRQRQRHPETSTSSTKPTTINAAAAELKAKGVHTIVVLLHEGGFQSGVADREHDRYAAPAFSGAIVDIVSNSTTKSTWSSAGTPTAFYNCMLPNQRPELIPVSSASSFGRLVTDIDMTINTSTDQPTSISVNNKIVFRDDAGCRCGCAGLELPDRRSRRSPTWSSARSPRTSSAPARARATPPANPGWAT